MELTTTELNKLDKISYEARVGELLVSSLPDDLYIPPEAFAILLANFEGPLDFLLYLVRKNGFDLRNIDIAPIASQYLNYIKMMQGMNVELASDYMVMAALLADIKSRLLLPKPKNTNIEDDPRKELLDRLTSYATIKQQAAELNHLSIDERDIFIPNLPIASLPIPSLSTSPVLQLKFDVHLLTQAIKAIELRPKLNPHQVLPEQFDLKARMDKIKLIIQLGKPVRFNQLLEATQGRLGVVVTFIGVLELIRQQYIKPLSKPQIGYKPQGSFKLQSAYKLQSGYKLQTSTDIKNNDYLTAIEDVIFVSYSERH